MSDMVQHNIDTAHVFLRAAQAQQQTGKAGFKVSLEHARAAVEHSFELLRMEEDEQRRLHLTLQLAALGQTIAKLEQET